jgi:hypothetical protein
MPLPTSPVSRNEPKPAPIPARVGALSPPRKAPAAPIPVKAPAPAKAGNPNPKSKGRAICLPQSFVDDNTYIVKVQLN